MVLPKPECKYGYNRIELEKILKDRFEEFSKWMNGQTMMTCDGRRWDSSTGGYIEDCPKPHGSIVYPWDLERFLAGKPVID